VAAVCRWLRMNNVRFRAMGPGDTIEIEVDLIEQMADAY
jgi:3-hydroxymyristoyl/3-hydroxydecanoyl-(acyl carrier protein) dehydratase